MENKIEILNKKINYFKGYFSQKDKIIIGLQNQNKELIEKLVKQKVKHNKSLQESKIELDILKNQIEDLKAQSNIIDRQKAQQKKEEVKKTIAINKVLNDDKVKLLQIIKYYRKSLVE